MRGGGGGDVDDGGSISGDDGIRCEPGVGGELATAEHSITAVDLGAVIPQFPSVGVVNLIRHRLVAAAAAAERAAMLVEQRWQAFELPLPAFLQDIFLL